MSGRRLYLTIAGLIVLVALTVVALVSGSDDDDETAYGTTTSTALLSGPIADEDLAATLLPPVSAIGPDWIETQRDDDATPVEPEPGGACPSGPVPEGFLIRAEQQRVQGGALVETLSITAGVVAEGVSAPSLDDDAVVTCLLEGLQAQVPEGATVTVAEDEPDLSPPPEGAEVSHAGYEVTGGDGIGGAFDFVLVQRGRVVSLGLLTGIDVDEPTALAEVVAALDRPLAAAAARG